MKLSVVCIAYLLSLAAAGLILLIVCLFGGSDSSKMSSETQEENQRPQGGESCWPKDASIAIIGAGLAGLSAADRLNDLGYKDVTIFEASGRIGGRVYPIKYEGVYIQYGAEYVKGKSASQKVDASQSTKSMDNFQANLREKVTFKHDQYLFGNGTCETVVEEDLLEFKKFEEELEAKLEIVALKFIDRPEENSAVAFGGFFDKAYNEWLESDVRRLKKRGIFDGLVRVYKSAVEVMWNADWHDLSLANLEQFDDSAFTERYRFNAGDRSILDYIGVNSYVPPEFLNFHQLVTHIDYSAPKVRITTDSVGVWPKRFDAVLVTVPLGHLKLFSKTLFTPPLPAKKQRTIDLMGYGALSKLLLMYEKPFWEKSFAALPISECTDEDRPTDQLFSRFYQLNQKDNILLGWLTGLAPAKVDAMTDEEVAETVTDLFRRAFRRDDIPPPKAILRKKWTTDPLFAGGYSYISVAAAKEGLTFADLAQPIMLPDGRPQLMFAGEATHDTCFHTALGAYLSGLREAQRLVGGTARDFHQPLVCDAL